MLADCHQQLGERTKAQALFERELASASLGQDHYQLGVALRELGTYHLSEGAFARAKPLKTVQPDLFQAWKRSRGRPTINDQPKKHIGFRWSADLVDALKASGKGYNGRAEAILRDALTKGRL